MKPLLVNSSMTNMDGDFYPEGHVFALFPGEDGARQAAEALQAQQHHGELAHATPVTIQKDILRTLNPADTALPLIGKEGDTLRHIDRLARSGHHGVLIQVTEKDTLETVQDILRQHGASAAFYYRAFAIEALVAP